MKRILNIVAIVFSLFSMMSCDDINSVHQEYLDKGEQLYIGAPYIVDAYSGYNRIELVWKLNADPKITETSIYWNNGKDSINVVADRSDTVMREIIDLPEDKYIFEMINRDRYGNTSLSEIISSESFGEVYKSELRNRSIISQVVRVEGGLDLNWTSEPGCVGMNFSYVNNKGEELKLKIGANEVTTFIPDYVPDGEFSYSSLYVPVSTSIDTIATEVSEGEFTTPPPYYLLTQADWAKYSGSHTALATTGWDITTNSEQPGSEITNILGTNGIWHCSHSSAGDKSDMPYIINLDMKAIQNVSSIELNRRSGNGSTKIVEVEYSTNNTNWTKLGKIEYATNSNTGSMVLLPAVVFEAQYLRLTIPEDGSFETQWATLAKLVVTTK